MTITSALGSRPLVGGSPDEQPARLTAASDDHVHVQLQRFWLFHHDLGDAPQAATSARISQVERQTVLDIDRGARALGLVGPGQSQITVTLRDTLAGSAGPYANGDKVGVPSGNVIASAARTLDNGTGVQGTGELFPFDVALHELGHVVQSQAMDRAGMQGLDAATRMDITAGLTGRLDATAQAAAGSAEASGLREGLSDATAAVITHDWQIGEEYFAPGSTIRAVRDISDPASAHTMETIETDYRLARAGLDGSGPSSHEVDGVTVRDDEGHSLGGIVSRSVYEFEQRRGWDDATALVATVQRDPELWREGGTLEAYRDRFLAAAAQLDTAHPGALDAARQSLRDVGYTVGDSDVGTSPAPPAVDVPQDPGPTTAGPGVTDRVDALSAAGTIAASTGVGAGIGAAIGGVVALVTPLNLKTGLILGGLLGGGVGALRGVASGL